LVPYYIRGKRKEATQAKDGKVKEGGEEAKPSTLCRVYNNKTRRVSNEELPFETVEEIREKFGNLGRKWLRDGKWVYALNKLVEGGYTIVGIPQTMEHPPSSLHRALMQHAVDEYYDMTPDKNFFQEHGKILLFVGAIIFLLWCVIMN